MLAASVVSRAQRVCQVSLQLVHLPGCKVKSAQMATRANQDSKALSESKASRVNRVTRAQQVTWVQRVCKANKVSQESLEFQVRPVRKDHVDLKVKLVPLDRLDQPVRKAMQELACLANKVHREDEVKKASKVQLENLEILESLVSMARMAPLVRMVKMDFLARMALTVLVDPLERKANKEILAMRSRMSYKYT